MAYEKIWAQLHNQFIIYSYLCEATFAKFQTMETSEFRVLIKQICSSEAMVWYEFFWLCSVGNNG